MANYSDKIIDLSGWDMAHAIRFKDVNQVIEKAYAKPLAFTVSQFLEGDDEYPDMFAELSASYTALDFIATDTGHQCGFFAKLSVQHFSISVLREAEPGDTIVVTHEGKNYASKKNDVLEFAYPIGVVGNMEFDWHSSESQAQAYKLMTANEVDKIEIIADKTVIHPNEEVLKNEIDKLILDIVIEQGLSQSLADEFNHILAEIDYTQVADHHATWLRPTLHGYATHLLSDTATTNDTPSDYVSKMNIDNYPTGFLSVLAMTNNRPKPDGIPDNLDKIIPPNCTAGFAYNHSLIIPNLIVGHLSEVFSMKDGDFDYTSTSTTTIHNVNAMSLKEKVRFDFSDLGVHPEVSGELDPYNVTITMDKGKIQYHTTTKYYVAKEKISLTFDYDIDILQTVDMSFDYQINEKGYALLLLSTEPNVSVIITPKLEETKHIKSFWEYAKNAGIDFLEMLAMAGVLAVLVKIGEAVGDVIKSVSKVKASSLEEVADMTTVLDSEKFMSEIKKIDAQVTDLEKGEAVISEDTERELIDSKKNKVVAFVKAGLKTIWEIIRFAVAGTLVQKAEQEYNQIELSKLTNEANHKAFIQFINTSLCTISWASQDDEQQFVVKEGGLAEGGFIVGMDIYFKS